MKALIPLILVLGAVPALAQDDADQARLKAQEARKGCADALKGVDGVSVLGIGGSGIEFRVLVSCGDADAKTAARGRLGGDAFQGIAVLWLIQPPASPNKPLPPAPIKDDPPAAPEAKPQDAAPDRPWKDTVEDCDIIRDYLKLKPVHHPIGNGRSLFPCQIIRRSVVGPGGGHTYVYTKHRDNCPIRLGRVAQPPWADNYVAWVFQKGFTPVTRGGFTWPFELRSDDKLWDQQAKGELKTRLPYIREAAEWASTPSGYVKITTPELSGWIPTGGHPGVGWSWSQPWQPNNVPGRVVTGAQPCCAHCAKK